MQNPSTPGSTPKLQFEALEPRILFDAAAGDAPVPEVTVDTTPDTVADDQLVNDDVEFTLTFDNTGGSEGYVPYVDFVAPPELEIQDVDVLGGPGQNPTGSAVTPIGEIAADGQLVAVGTTTPVSHPVYEPNFTGAAATQYGGAGSGTPPVTYDVASDPSLIGQYVYSVQLPFGSFTEDNLPVDVNVTASLDTADGVLPNQDYEIIARGGFALGCDPLNNAGTVTTPVDEPVFGDFDSDSVHPYVMQLSKTAEVSEEDGPYTGERASGPNHPITYQLEVNIAEGETITGLNILDVLPPDLAYTGNLTVSFGTGTGGTLGVTTNNEPEINTDNLTGVDPSDDTLSITIDQIIGNDPANGADIIITYEAFAAYQESGGSLVIDATSGEEDDIEHNDASISGTWSGNAVSDNAGPLLPGDPDGIIGEVETDYAIEEHSIAIQKGVAFADDPATLDPTPDGDRAVADVANSGDVLEYTMNFQISDYFAFTDVVVDDTLGDGQDFLPGDGSNVAGEPLEIVPHLDFTMHGNSVSIDFDPANFSWVPNAGGTTTLHFDVYQQLVDDGFVVAGDALLGGFIDPAGILPADLATFDAGATTGSITYRVQVRESFNAGGQPAVSQGDTLDNTVTITGQNRDITTFAPLAVVTDGSSSSIAIPTGSLVKETVSVFSHGQLIPVADDNDPTTPPPVNITAEDLVTYRIRYTLPLTEFENLVFQDFLPLPIFDVASLDTSQIHDFDAATAYTTAGRISWGPGDTFVGPEGPDEFGDGGIDDLVGYEATAPTVVATIDNTTLADSNGFIIDIGDYTPGAGNDPVTRVVEFLVTVPVIDSEFADNLVFTNQVGVSEANTLGTTVETDEIAQINVVEPELNITKGVTAVANPSGVFAGSTGPTGITFNAPGSATGWDIGSGTINSDALDTGLIDANLSNVDAGDLVTFFVVVENTGSSEWGAFDTSISDTIPNGFAIPGGGANLRVSYGDGTAIPPVTGYTGDLFTTPLELIDGAIDAGAIEQFNATSGRNVVVIAYDLIIESDVEALQSMTNVAEIETYAATEGGADHADPGEHVDVATVQVAAPTVDKIITDTSHDDTNNTDLNAEVAIGEVVTYQVTISIPEGEMNAVRVLDTLPAGMAFVGLDSVVLSNAADVTSPDGDLATDLVGFYNAGASILELGYATAGVPGLGNVVNANTDNATPETITMTYRAVVLNDAVNQQSLLRPNDAEIRWDLAGNEQVVDDSASVLIVEPDINVTKTVEGGDTDVEGADQVTYRIRVENQNSSATVSEAYEVDLSDVLPADISFVSAVYDTGVLPDGVAASGDPVTFTAPGVGAPEGTISASWARLGVGEFSEILVTVRVDDGLATDTVITNTAEVEYTSLPNSPGGAGYTGLDPATFGPNINPADPIYNIAVERTGDPGDPGGAANDYVDTSPVEITVINPLGINKAIIDTSEAHTGADSTAGGAVNGAIGEVVRYEVRLRLPQAESGNLQLVDTLDAGLFWIDAAANNLQISLEGFSNPANLVADADIAAANGTTIALDTSRVAFDAGSNTATFSFGDITNLETDAGDEFIVLSYNTIVRNDVGVSRGDVLSNSVQMREGGSDVGGPMTVDLTVVAPVLDIAKTDTGVTSADAGDVIDYTLTISSDSNANAATAFDLNITDAVPAELEITSVLTFDLTGTTGSVIVSQGIAGQNISAVVDHLDPGESFTITFQARVRDAGANIIHSDETVTNTANLTYSGLPGDGTDNGVGENTTGNEAGTPGTESGERISTDSGSDSFTTPTPTISKVLANPAVTNFTIGEPVEYVITIQVPEGRVGSPEAFVLDAIDPGFRFLPGTLTVTPGAGVTVGEAGALSEANSDFFTHTDPGDVSVAEGLRFDFDFIDFNNAAAADGLNRGSIEIRYQLQVENIVANQEGDTLNNTADLFYTDDDGATRNTVTDFTGDLDTVITIVEPTVEVAKTITSIPTDPEAGDTVSYRIEIEHTGTAFPNNVAAFDITVLDNLPANLDLQTGTFTATRVSDSADVSGLFTVTASNVADDGSGDIDLQPATVLSSPTMP